MIFHFSRVLKIFDFIKFIEFLIFCIINILCMYIHVIVCIMYKVIEYLVNFNVTNYCIITYYITIYM